MVRARREPKNIAKKIKNKKGIPKKPQHVFFHVFAQTTYVVAVPLKFACVGIPAWLYIPSFIEIRSGISEPQGSKFALSYYVGYWLLQQLVLSVQAVIGVKL